MFAAILAFFANALPILNLATSLLPIMAMARSMNDPAVTNAGLLNTMKAIQFVQPIVQHVENVSNAGPKMSGADKLALFQAVVQEAYSATTGAGIDNKFTETLPLLNAAVAAVCAAMKQPAAPVPAVQAPAITAPQAAPLQNNA